MSKRRARLARIKGRVRRGDKPDVNPPVSEIFLHKLAEMLRKNRQKRKPQ